jgi:hypothetical protein
MKELAGYDTEVSYIKHGRQANAIVLCGIEFIFIGIPFTGCTLRICPTRIRIR